MFKGKLRRVTCLSELSPVVIFPESMISNQLYAFFLPVLFRHEVETRHASSCTLSSSTKWRFDSSRTIVRGSRATLSFFKRQRAGRKILKIVSFFFLSSLWITSDPGTFLNSFSLCLHRLLHPIVIIVNT